MKLSGSIQKLLPLGYFFLVVLGILKESVFYYQIGINILKYSTIMDILISPIATLTAHPIILVAFLILVLGSYAFPILIANQSHKKWVQKLSFQKDKEALGDQEVGKHLTEKFIKLLAVVLLSFFLGIGIGEGLGLTEKIMIDKLEYGRKLTYNTGESEEIYLISLNSVYYFYLSKGNKSIKIAPIGAIKYIEFTKNKMLK